MGVRTIKPADLSATIIDRRRRIRRLTGNGGGGRGALRIRQFADQAGLSVSFLSKFVRGELPNPIMSTLMAIDAALVVFEGDKKIMASVKAIHAKRTADLAAKQTNLNAPP